MFLYIFAGFLLGYVLSLWRVRSPREALVLGLVLGGLPLALLLWFGTRPVQGIGSTLYFAFFALGPIMLLPIMAFSAALGMAGASAVLWAGQSRPRWVRLALGTAILGLAASLTLAPVAQREMAKRQLSKNLEIRAQAMIRADFSGTLANHRVTFPASPRLSASHTCASVPENNPSICVTNLTNPVTVFTKPDDMLLHERSDPVAFGNISISPVAQDCRPGNEFCLTQEKIDRWCRDIRPDYADTIWCRASPALRFTLRANSAPGPSDRNEPELSARYADTVLGPGRVTCFYSPDQTETHRQGASCSLHFDLASEVTATLAGRREQITSDDPAIIATLAVIPEYWASLAGKR